MKVQPEKGNTDKGFASCFDNTYLAITAKRIYAYQEEAKALFES
jgi:hypothetical protein